MNFLANENFPFPSVKFLREKGINVRSISEVHPGIPDEQVIEMAKKNNLKILTFDKDYGELIFKNKINNPPVVIFFRYKGSNPNFAGKRLFELLQYEDISFDNSFTVVEKEGIRQKLYNKLK